MNNKIKANLMLAFILFSGHCSALDILFIHSYHQTYPWVTAYSRAFQQQLNPHSVLQHYMDTKHIHESQFQHQATVALNLINKHQPKVVVVADDNALKLVGKPAIEQGYTVIFLGVNNNPRQYMTISPNLAGVLERPLLMRSVAQLRRIVPQTRKILILMDNGVTTSAIISTSLRGLEKLSIGNIQLEVKKTNHFKQWKYWVSQSKKERYDLIIIANYAKLTNEQHQPVSLDAASIWTSAQSPIPVFGFWKFSVGKNKAIGGLVLSGYHQGQSAAEIANYFLLHKELPKPLIKTPTKGQYIFSRLQLKRWQLALPADIEKHTLWTD